MPGAQNNAGELLGHVRDIGGDPRTDRQFKTSAEISLHCDTADVVGLLCLHPSRPGTGTSRLVSTVAVFAELLRDQPAMAARLRQWRFLLDTRGTAGINFIRLPAVAYAAPPAAAAAVRQNDGDKCTKAAIGELRTFWHSEYFQSWTQ